MNEIGVFLRKRDSIKQQARTETIRFVLEWLRIGGHEDIARDLQRVWGYQEPGHVCSMVDGECYVCGARE